MIKKAGWVLLFITIGCTSYAQQSFTLDALKDSIKKIMDKEHIPGLMLALVHRDSVIWAGGVGLADRENNIPVDENSLFRIGSITKSFTTLSVLQLINEGKFSLDSKLKDIAPEIVFENKWESEAPVRVINLLEHTAGFDDMHFASFVNLTGKKMSALEEVLAHRKAMHSRWKPGTRMSYSNPGYAALGYLIEKYSGMPYEEFISQTIFRPLGMTHTDFNYKIQAPYATGYSYHDKYYTADPVVINGGAAGAISSCASDMAKYVRMYLNEGKSDSTQIVGVSTIHEMEWQHSTVASQAGLTTGYGLANYARMLGDKNKEYFRGHSGGIMGFSSDFGYSRQWGVGYAISNNGEGPSNDIKNKILAFLLQGKSTPLPAGKKLDVGKLKNWEGLYRLKSPRNEIASFIDNIFSTSTINLKGDTLYVQDFLQDAVALIPVTDLQFRKKDEPVATYVFAKFDNDDVFVRDADFMVRANPVAVWSLRVVLAISVISGLLLLPFTIAWLIMLIRKKLSRQDFLIRLVSFFAIASFASMLFTFIDLFDLRNITGAAFVNRWTFTIFLTSILFPSLSLLALYFSIKNFKKTRSAFIRYYLLTGSLSFCFLSFYLYQYHWLGLMLWTY